MLKSYLQTFVFSFAVFFQGIITLPILIRVSGIEVYGTYVLLLTISSFLFGISSFGAGYRFRRALPSIDDPGRRREVFEPQFFFQMSVLLAISLVWYLLHWLFLPALGTGAARISWYLPCGWVFAYFLLAQATDYFRYSHRMMRFNIGASAPSYMFVALVALFALLHKPLTVDRLIELQIVSSLASSLPLLTVAFLEMGFPRPHFALRVMLDDIRQGFPLVLEYVMDYLMASSDRYFIALFISVVAVGQYQPGYQLAYLVFFLPKIAYVVLVPQLSRLVDLNQIDQAEALMDRFANFFLLLAVPFCVGALFVAPSLLSWLATRVVGEASRWVTPLVAFGGIFFGFSLLGSMAAFVMKRTRAILGASVSGAITSVALNALVLPHFPSIVVPAITSAVGYVVSCGVMLTLLKQHWRLHISLISLYRFCAASAVMSAVLWSVGLRPGQVSSLSPLVLLASIAAGAVAYFASVWVLGGHTPKTMRALR